MRHRCLRSLGVSAIAVGLLVTIPVIGPGLATAQTRSGDASVKWSGPRTSFGHPDLQGVWDFASITPFERPERFEGREFMTAEESAAFERDRFSLVDHDTPEGATFVCRGTGNYNEFWYDRGFGDVVASRRTALVIDPPDGKIPPLTPKALERRQVEAAARAARGTADSYEYLGLGTRCIVGFNAGPPMIPSAYNNNVQLFQTPDHVVILNEMVHDARIVPLDGSSHLTQNVRQLAGDSRGHWVGDTLVVETTNFTSKTSVRGSTDRLHLVERFTPVDADTLLYVFTVDDPTTFTRPWTVEVVMTRSDGKLYEYACHEGNYGMEGILAGARAEEQAAAATR